MLRLKIIRFFRFLRSILYYVTQRCGSLRGVRWGLIWSTKEISCKREDYSTQQTVNDHVDHGLEHGNKVWPRKLWSNAHIKIWSNSSILNSLMHHICTCPHIFYRNLFHKCYISNSSLNYSQKCIESPASERLNKFHLLVKRYRTTYVNTLHGTIL